MKKHIAVILILVLTTLYAACRSKDAPAGTATLLSAPAAADSFPSPTPTNREPSPTATNTFATGSPTANPENDRPAPPTEGPRPTATQTQLPSRTPTATPSNTPTPGPSPTPSATIYKTATPGPSLTPTHTATITDTPSDTPTGTPATPTPSNTPSTTPTATATETPTPTATPTPEPEMAFTVQFSSNYSCEGYEFLTFRVENTSDLPMEYSKVLIIDLAGPDEVTNSYTNWPFQTNADGCLNDLGLLPAGQSAYLPVPIIESPGPPPYPGDHSGRFTFCSENYYLQERGVCHTEEITFTVP